MNYQTLIKQLRDENAKLQQKIQILQNDNFERRLLFLEEELRSKSKLIDEYIVEFVIKSKQISALSQQNVLLKKAQLGDKIDFEKRLDELKKIIEDQKLQLTGALSNSNNSNLEKEND